jgi:hypothetical protein
VYGIEDCEIGQIYKSKQDQYNSFHQLEKTQIQLAKKREQIQVK